MHTSECVQKKIMNTYCNISSAIKVTSFIENACLPSRLAPLPSTQNSFVISMCDKSSRFKDQHVSPCD